MTKKNNGITGINSKDIYKAKLLLFLIQKEVQRDYFCPFKGIWVTFSKFFFS